MTPEALHAALAPYFLAGEKQAVLGVGSVLRNDDAAGMLCVDALSHLCNSGNLMCVGGSTAPENMTGVIKDFNPDTLIIIDAAFMGMNPGEFAIIDSGDIGGASFSTHMLPLSLTLAYLKAETGCRTVVVGIQPQNTEQGTEVCSAVTNAANKLSLILTELAGAKTQC